MTEPIGSDDGAAERHRALVHEYWRLAEARQWGSYAELLHPHVVYHLPQTGETIRGAERYLRFNTEYPDIWHATVRTVVADAEGAVSRIDMEVGAETLPAVSFFTFDSSGLITGITEFWPEPYQPPAGREHLVEPARHS
ncbi:nuclear transport factor 2 family protein [Nakamurella aerolata]|uniref:Nuclear transport factor 2 family protein n=1 Tax=Nakamurella aerolata TaxID=1656892 RepID=A0A849AAH0_9ACTN|nr:nuclear transport factor 2 family protein [Nakamurella aerolata]NNG35480.1 nuclear transport factor 2 family protein [Nakamurella aerolata]